MSFIFEKEFPTELIISSSIREKIDIIEIILNFMTSHYAQGNKEFKKDKPLLKISVYQNKVSRLFINLDNKIHSFCFPFTIKIIEGEKVFFLNDTQIDMLVLSILQRFFTVFRKNYALYGNLDEYLDLYIIDELENNIEIKNIIDTAIITLLTFESGYIRYDHDIENAEEILHPLDHLDVNYTSRCTYKLGLKSKLDIYSLCELLSQKCKVPYLNTDYITK